MTGVTWHQSLRRRAALRISSFGLPSSFGIRHSSFTAMNFAHPHFAEPRWLWLAVLGPLALIALQRYSAWARHRQLAQLAAPEFVAELTRSHSPIRRAIKEAMLVLAVAGIGLALARPQWGEQAEASHLLGQDIVFILDCSRSMLATDVAPEPLAARQARHPRVRATPRARTHRPGGLCRPGLPPMPAHLRLRRLPGCLIGG